jgi:hypothetical protein
MAVTEQDRLALRAAVRAVLGDEEGDTLMAITAPANSDLATRQDLERLQQTILSGVTLELTRSLSAFREEFTRSLSEFREEMMRSDSELRAEMTRSDSELRAEMTRSDSELRAEMTRSDSELRAEITRSANSTLRWMIATVLLAQGGTIGLLGIMLR